MPIINLTQHTATAEQQEAGVYDLNALWRSELQTLLTFNEAPTAEKMADRADRIVYVILAALDEAGFPNDWPAAAMLGGAPFFMATLERALLTHGVEPVYAFSVRESVEKTTPDGDVVKHNVFRHTGFVRPYLPSAPQDASA